MMTPKTLSVLERCVEDGVELGYNRAHKHTNTPPEDIIKQEIVNAVLTEIHEWFDFPEPPPTQRN